MHYMTDDVLILIDGVSTDFDEILFPVYSMKGFKHGCPRSPYRNVALGLKNIVEIYPDYDWYCYLEYDCLITSDRFKSNLQMADDRDVWMLGCDGHIDDKEIPLLNAILHKPLKSSYYLLGACQFFNGRFMRALLEMDFFNKFLALTNSYSDGFMPGYTGYDVSEHLYPSLARQLGGNIGVFSSWEEEEQRWHGSHELFPIRFRPDLDPVTENFAHASIQHPLKSFSHPIRQHHRKMRYVSKINDYCNDPRCLGEAN